MRVYRDCNVGVFQSEQHLFCGRGDIFLYFQKDCENTVGNSTCAQKTDSEP